jgi:hypothetical protein
MTLFDWPSWAMLKVPSLFSFMTAGMEGNTQQASSWSRTGATAATIWGGEHGGGARQGGARQGQGP